MTEQELLKQLEKRLKKEYKDTEAVISEKIAYFTKDFDKDNKLYQQRLKNGEITKQEYRRWYKDQMFNKKWANNMASVIAQDLTDINVTASNIINNDLSQMFMFGCLEASDELKDYSPFDVFDTKQIKQIADNSKRNLPKSRVKIPKDKKWNERRIRSSLMQSAIKGESVRQLASRLKVVVGMNQTSAIRNARTMMTASHNMGKLELGQEANEMGIDVRKQWIATFDNRTRDSHAYLHEEVVDMNEEFSNGLMFPGDPDGDPSEVYNCRCTMVITHDPKRGGMSKEEFKENVEENEAEKEAFKQANKDLKNGVQSETNNIVYDFKGHDKEWAESKKLIDKLASEYETKLQTVTVGSQKSAGSVGISSTDMHLSSKKPNTIIHEFAHTIALNKGEKLGLGSNPDFWKEIKKIQRQYKKDVENSVKDWISTYEHSSRDVDEFFAEAFTLGKMKEMGISIPEKYGTGKAYIYSNKILEVANRYFKKKHRK